MSRYLLAFLLAFSIFTSPLASIVHAEEGVPAEPITETTQPGTVAEPATLATDEPVVVDDADIPGEEVILPSIETIEAMPMLDEEPIVTQAEATTTDPIISASSTAFLLIRYGETVAWSGDVEIPAAGTVQVTPTGGSPITVNAQSLLSVLTSVDAAQPEFAITDLDYYPDYGSFIINCISAQAFTEACSQWQYAVNGTYASIGTDQWTLRDGDKVYLYFGSPRRVTAPASVVASQAFTATAESYDPSNNTYSPLPGYTIGATQPDPNNPWSPKEIATSTTAANGTVSFALTAPGTYNLGLKEDFYFPTVPVVVSTTTETGPGTGGPNDAHGFSVSKASSYLISQQKSDGSFSSDIVTDWSALALSGSSRASLASYLRSEEPRFRSVRDYERHAMALMALGINPYTGGPSDYITPIVKTFNGEQIDSPTLVNDDIFALIPLLHAGYTTKDDIVRKSVAFIVSEQRSDGSWESSPSITAAAIQLLTEVASLPGTGAAVMRGETYLRNAQRSDGGFGDNPGMSDPFATSWVIQAIHAMGGNPESWVKNEKDPIDYLASIQETDGSVTTTPDDETTRAWAVAYAIPAVQGITWDDAMRTFSKPASAGATRGNAASSTAATTTQTTTTPELPAVDPLIDPVVLDMASSTAMLPALVTPLLEKAVAVTDAGTVTIEEVREEVASTTSAIDLKDLTAGAANAGILASLSEMITSFWSALKSFFGKIF